MHFSASFYSGRGLIQPFAFCLSTKNICVGGYGAASLRLSWTCWQVLLQKRSVANLEAPSWWRNCEKKYGHQQLNLEDARLLMCCGPSAAVRSWELRRGTSRNDAPLAEPKSKGPVCLISEFAHMFVNKEYWNVNWKKNYKVKMQ